MIIIIIIIIIINFLHCKISCFFGALELWKNYAPFLNKVGYVNDSRFLFFHTKNLMHSLFLFMSEKEYSNKKSTPLWKMLFTFDGIQGHINS